VTQSSDDELMARLRDADPAASLTPVSPERAARLLEDAMSDDVLTETRETGTRGRGPLTWLVAAAAAVVIVGAGAFTLLAGGDDEVEQPATVAEATVTELRAPAAEAYDARCMVPSAEVLAGKQTAFSGTVDEIDGDLVTLTPDHWYAGNPTEVVTVSAPDETLAQLLSAVEFEDGGRYLVAADDRGDVMVCGFSAPWSAELADVYAEAFGS